VKTTTVGTSTTTYTYNALGQRIKKAPQNRYYAYDEAGHLIGDYNSSVATKLYREMIWMGDIPVAVLTQNSDLSVNIWYIHTDHLNTPRKITRPSDNAVRWTWNPDPFGNGTSLTRTPSLPSH
jgi:hypothetical protein